MGSPGKGRILGLAWCQKEGWAGKSPHQNALLFDERYVNAVMNRGQQVLCEYDEKIHQGASAQILEEANKKILDMVKEESDKALAQILKNASQHMKIRGR